MRNEQGTPQTKMRWSREELTYCSNVHPGASLAKVSQNVSEKIKPVAQQRKTTPMATGLWFANDCANQLSSHRAERERFFSHLAQQGLYLGTLNGFPYGDFHQAIVKQKVYLPTWADSTRLDYTIKLAHLLAQASSSNSTPKEKSISTLPLAYAKNWTHEQHLQACINLCKLTQHLQEIEHATGQHIRVCLEMEPDCVLESTHQLVNFFICDLEQTAAKLKINTSLVYRYLGCCYDTCHQAVMHESIFGSMLAINNANICIGKVQISNAPAARISNEQQLKELNSIFNEPKFLHQVKIKTPDKIISFPDLPSTGEHNSKKTNYNTLKQYYDYPWHIHFHIPIYTSSLEQPFLTTTQQSIIDVFKFLSTHQNSLYTKPFLEVETYTWAQFQKDHVTQTNQHFNLTAGIVSELNWLEQQLEIFDLLSIPS